MFEDSIRLHQKFGISGAHTQSHRLSPEERAFRIEAMQEELDEFITSKTLEDDIDALVDLVVFAMGTAERMGIKWDAHWKEVLRANMEKELCGNKDSSKRNFELDLCKPEGWRPPNHELILFNEDVKM